jgi:hypothetical protein
MGKVINTNTSNNEVSLGNVVTQLEDQNQKMIIQRYELVQLKNELKLNNFYNGMAADTVVDVDDIINNNGEE